MRPRFQVQDISTLRYGCFGYSRHSHTAVDLGCLDKSEASANRLRVQEGYGNAFYDQQARMTLGWAFNTLPPEDLIIENTSYTMPIMQASLRRLDDTD